ncbi:MAG: cereblon family protein [Planctomycetota bacterium]|jgi:hypothetical protein
MLRRRREEPIFLIPKVHLPGLGPRLYRCAQCGTPLASERDRIRVMGRPSRARYQNPHGVQCEILTFSEAVNLKGADFSTEEHTWFEGYAWRPVSCVLCGTHMGWRFEASGPHLEPQTFLGLLVSGMREGPEEEEKTE